jgi:hypothetical protein
MNSTAAKALEIRQCNNQATASNPLFILELFKLLPKSSGLFVSFVYNLPGWEIILLVKLRVQLPARRAYSPEGGPGFNFTQRGGVYLRLRMECWNIGNQKRMMV